MNESLLMYGFGIILILSIFYDPISSIIKKSRDADKKKLVVTCTEQKKQTELKEQETIEVQKVLSDHFVMIHELDELKQAINQEKKEAKQKMVYNDPIVYNGYCNFLVGDYCRKYDFEPANCGPKTNEYGCTFKERRFEDYKLNYNEDLGVEDISDEKRLTMFGEYYYDKTRFNEENYEDMLDFYDNKMDHLDD